MKKSINTFTHVLLAVAYAFIGYHSVIIMFTLIMQADGLSDMLCAIATDIMWSLLLLVGGVLIYSITFTKTNNNGTN